MWGRTFVPSFGACKTADAARYRLQTTSAVRLIGRRNKEKPCREGLGTLQPVSLLVAVPVERHGLGSRCGLSQIIDPHPILANRERIEAFSRTALKDSKLRRF